MWNIKITPHPQQVCLDRGFTMLKAFAALIVAMGHYSGHAADNGVTNIMYRLLSIFGGYTGVAIFFFLSGYGLMMSEKKHHLPTRMFFARRLFRVYAPVVLVSAIWGIVIWPESEGISHFPRYLRTVFISFGDGILWFIRVIALMYVLFALYVRLPRRPVLRFVLLLTGTAMAYACVYTFEAPWAAVSVPLFALGIIVAEHPRRICRVCRSWWFAVWLLSLALVFFVLYQMYGNLYLHSLSNYLVITSIILLASLRNVQVQIPEWVGGASYDIYLTHNKVLKYCTPLYGYIAPQHFIIGTIIATAASYSIRKLIKL